MKNQKPSTVFLWLSRDSLFKMGSNVTKFGKLSLWGYSLSTYAKLSEELAILYPDRHMYVCALGLRIAGFSENFVYVLSA